MTKEQSIIEKHLRAMVSELALSEDFGKFIIRAYTIHILNNIRKVKEVQS